MLMRDQKAVSLEASWIGVPHHLSPLVMEAIGEPKFADIEHFKLLKGVIHNAEAMIFCAYYCTCVPSL